MSAVTNDSILSQLIALREEVAALRQDVVSLERRVGGKPSRRSRRDTVHRDLSKLRRKMGDVEDRLTNLENQD